MRSRAIQDGGCPPYWLFRQLVRDITTIHEPNECQRADLTVIAPGSRSGAVPPDGPPGRRFQVFESVREFLADAAADAGWTHGNPFFVAELDRLLDSGPGALPKAVRDTIRVRLNALTSACREVLCAAAVLGTDIDPAAVAAVTQRDEAAVLTALDEAATVGIVASGGWRFSHDLIRDTAWLELPTAARLAEHARMADYLRRQDDAAPAVIAHHLLESLPVGDTTEAARWVAAGQAALPWTARTPAIRLRAARSNSLSRRSAGSAAPARAGRGSASRNGRRCNPARSQFRAYVLLAVRVPVHIGICVGCVRVGVGDHVLVGASTLVGTPVFASAPVFTRIHAGEHIRIRIGFHVAAPGEAGPVCDSGT